MAKSTTVTGLIGASTRKIPFYHKVDMWSTFILCVYVFGLFLLWSALGIDHVIVYAPYELLAHSPISLNITAQGTTGGLMCNPHFATFYNKSSYFTQDFIDLNQTRSPEFLALPEVAASVDEMTNSSTHPTVVLAFMLSDLCQYIRPNLDSIGCQTYEYIESTCLPDGDCGTDPNICFWKQPFRMANLYCMAHIGFSLISGICLLLLVYDPPPIGFGWAAKPSIAATVLFLTGLFGLIYDIYLYQQAQKMMNHAVLRTDYADYSFGMGIAWTDTVISAIAFFAFSAIFVYVTFFTPKYPRQKPRLQQRRGYFEQQSKKFREQTASSA
ncbi:unnamed protein product [Clavelina lepadiformis]|uniref:Uncharacterized protein n=1 Tax=Clavelina lepadiformis TaxID=159417 RepID=A0ABP0H0B1_CLALP